ncbi:MAG: polysaccharide deacetylase family protein [Bacteroidetes bacterium]|nr:polysaccharide deacetylase family protein [Bacteroidota bacterium]
MNFVQPPFFVRWLSPEYVVCDLPGPEKVIYLTFDDGPVPEATTQVLDILSDYHAHATFFMVGDNVHRHPEAFNRVKQDGHAIGNHTFHHLNGWHTPPGAYIEDVYSCREYFNTKLFRPPYGRFTPSQYFLLRKDFRFILWSALTYDFDRRTTPGQCLKNAIDHTTNGSIVVFHDSLKSLDNVRYTLPRFLEHFSNLKYRFQTLGNIHSAPSSAKL